MWDIRAGRNYDVFPVNAYEAEGRRNARFTTTAATPPAETCGRYRKPTEINPYFPYTLDLRR